jgi:arylsulfatase A-like enzyme
MNSCSRRDSLSKGSITDQENKHLPNILILIFDALSARNMSLYGYPRKTTPQIEEASKSGIIYHRHYSAGNFTSPGVGSFLTGTYPWTHRSFNVGGSVIPDYQNRNLFSLLNKDYFTFSYTHNDFVEIFFDQFHENIDFWIPQEEFCLGSLHTFPGDYLAKQTISNEVDEFLFWRTPRPSAALFSSRFVHKMQQSMMEKINREFQDEFPRGIPNFTTKFFRLEDALDWILENLEKLPQPYLGYIHLYPPHYPYNTRKEFIGIFDDHWNPPEKPNHPLSQNYSQDMLNYHRMQYDEYIAYADAEFGRFFSNLQQQDLLSDTLLILTSDHGEIFERGILAHDSATLFEPLCNIPLIIWSPSHHNGLNFHSPTSSVDLLPTFLSLLGEPVPGWSEGNILPGFTGASAKPHGNVFLVEAKENPKLTELTKVSLSLIKGDYKIIHYLGYTEAENDYEFYNLINDPDELINLADSKNQQFIEYRNILSEEFFKKDILYRRI